MVNCGMYKAPANRTWILCPTSRTPTKANAVSLRVGIMLLSKLDHHYHFIALYDSK